MLDYRRIMDLILLLVIASWMGLISGQSLESLEAFINENLPPSLKDAELPNIDIPSNISLTSVAPSAFDAIAFAKLIRRAPCPGTKGSGKNCTYPATPNSGPIQWTCEPGYFCLGPTQKKKCDPGFFCPGDSVQPIWCPKSFYCSNDTTTLEICPHNFFCPLGTVKPLQCASLAYCPAGSSEAPKYALLILLLIVILIPIILFKWKAASERVRKLKHQYEVHAVQSKQNLNAELKLSKLSKTFDVEFRGLTLTLPSGVTIMDNVSGVLRSGRTTAIMGPSGSGKTTLITLLTGKVKRTKGSVTINGESDELSNYKKLIGYVPQEDIMLRELTVREILMHSARMRLPSHWSYKKIKAKVLEIISFLGLSHVIDSVVGNEEERGISGGQRKRVNIGMELVAEPSVLFLDEPTSGLDSSTAFDVCSRLKAVAAQQGLTVGAVIHSPSPSTFNQFDDLLLLGKGGKVVYMGARKHAVRYFESIGFPCPESESPSDFFMDIVCGRVESTFDPYFSPDLLPEYWEKTMLGIAPLNEAAKLIIHTQQQLLSIQDPSVIKNPNLKNMTIKKRFQEPAKKLGMLQAFAVSFRASINSIIFWFKDLFEELGSFIKRTFRAILCIRNPVRNSCSMPMQIYLLTRRAGKQVFRTASTIIYDLLLHFGVGSFISISIQKFEYLGSFPPEICFTQARDLQRFCWLPIDSIREGGMFIALGALFAGISAATSTFGKEKVVFWRDTASGMSSIPYYIAKSLVDLPRIILGGVTFTSALLLFYPLKGSFVGLLVIVELLYLIAFAMGYFLSIAFKPSNTPLIGAAFALLWSLVLSGVTPTLKDVQSGTLTNYLQFLWVLSPPRWSIEAFWLLEVSGSPFANKNKKPLNNYEWNNMYVDIMWLGILLGIWNVLAFLALKLFNRDKQR